MSLVGVEPSIGNFGEGGCYIEDVAFGKNYNHINAPSVPFFPERLI